jgi:hypothetical protein
VDVYAKKLLEHPPNNFKAGSVFDMLRYGPTLQAMKALIQSLVLLRDKLLAAVPALMNRRSEFDYLSLNPARSHQQIMCTRL